MKQLLNSAVDSKGIWRLSDARCAIGCVVFAHYDNHVGVVRKSAVKGYEFSGKWAFPGGLVRGSHPGGLLGALKYGIKKRAAEEASLALEDIRIPEGRLGIEYPVTRYTVRGEEEFTAILPVVSALKHRQPLAPQDHSISEALWVPVLEIQNLELAPANALIAHWLAKTCFDIELPRPELALATCERNAELIFGIEREA